MGSIAQDPEAGLESRRRTGRATSTSCTHSGSTAGGWSGGTSAPMESEVWAKPMADGERVAVLLVNLSDDDAAPLGLMFANVPGIPADATVAVRDLWARKDLGVFTATYETEEKVPPHGSVMLMLRVQ